MNRLSITWRTEKRISFIVTVTSTTILKCSHPFIKIIKIKYQNNKYKINKKIHTNTHIHIKISGLFLKILRFLILNKQVKH